MQPWYKEAFGALYPIVYSHRDSAEAKAVGELLIARQDIKNLRLLDLACGTGRVSRVLKRFGAVVTGLDLSPELLQEAGRPTPHLPLIRGDMRFLPFQHASMDGVLSIFTSFGYFDEESQDLEVLDEVKRIVKPDGFFMIDLSNPSWVRRSLVPESERSKEEWTIFEKRRLEEDRFGKEEGRVIKEVRLRNEKSGRELQWTESVRLYSRERMMEEFQMRGFHVEKVWGHYDGSPPDGSSPRLIYFTRVRAERNR